MDLLAVENDIVAKLKADITGLQIEAFPEDPEQFFRNLHGIGAILVRYDSSDYEIPKANRKQVITQTRTARWAIWVIYRGLITHDLTDSSEGLYTRLDAVKNSLTGYTIGTQSSAAVANASVMYPIRDQFVDENDGLWYHEIVFEHTTPEVES